MPTSNIERCPWADSNPLLTTYHDEEWGVPVHDSRALWESLMLEGFQAGLSWLTILRKRDEFRQAFHHFNPEKVAAFTEADTLRLLDNPGIIRSRAKIHATIHGAQIYLAMQHAGEDFAETIWALAGNKPIRNNSGTIPVKTALAETISASLKKRGFKFVGPIITYAWLQSNGIVNDHIPSCFRHNSQS